MDLVARILATIREVNLKLRWFGNFCLWVLTFIVIKEVLMRYLFNSPSGLTVELARALQNYMGFVCAGFVQIQKAHLNMDNLLDYFSPKTKNSILAIGSLMAFLFCAIMGYYSWVMLVAAYRMGEVTTLLEWPMSCIKAGTVIGYALLGLQYLVDTWDYYNQVRGSKE
jgi:TRAP-type C4-dicarboxylate transport system permease small subunit